LVARISRRPAVVRTAAPIAASAVFTRANLRLNIGGWLAFFCLQLIAYAFISWAPVLLTMLGWPLPHAIRGSLVFNLSAVCASLAAGWLLGWVRVRTFALIGSFGAIPALALLYALFVAQAPFDPANEWIILGAIALVSVLAGWGIATIYTLLSFGYPTGCRAGGIGFGLMAGRAGGITSAFTGGALLAIDSAHPLPFFGLLMIAGAVAGLAVILLGPRYAGRLVDMA
jgi:hypothetical protein